MSDSEWPRFLKRSRSSTSSILSIGRPQPKRRRAVSSASASGPATDDNALRFPHSSSRSIGSESSQPESPTITTGAGHGAMPRYWDLPDTPNNRNPVLDTVPVVVGHQLAAYELGSKQQKAVATIEDSPEHDVDQSGDYDPQSDSSASPKPKRRNRRKSKSKKRADVDPLLDLHELPSEVNDDGLTAPVEAVSVAQRNLSKAELRMEGLKAAKELGACDEGIETIFKSLGLPLIMKRLPLGLDERGEARGHYVASTMTQKILRGNGKWDFYSEVNANHRGLDAAEAYKKISTGSKFLPIDHPPISMPTVDQRNAFFSLDSDVVSFLGHIKATLDDDGFSLYIPDIWGSDKIWERKVEMGVLPQRFRSILEKERAVESRQESDSSAEPTLPSDPMDDELETPVQKRGYLLTLPIASPESPLLYRSRQAETQENLAPVSLPPPNKNKTAYAELEQEATFLSEESVAERLVKQHDLKSTLEDAQKLVKLLKDDYTTRQCHQRLCEVLGTVKHRSLNDPDNPLAAPVRFPSIKYAEKGSIELEDKTRRTGNASLNEDASNPKYGAAAKLLDWFGFLPMRKGGETNASKSVDDLRRATKGKNKAEEDKISEIVVETLVGGLIKGMFWGQEHVQETVNKRKHVLDCFRLFGTDPQPDYGVRLAIKDRDSWGLVLQVYLFTGECKPSTELDNDTVAQMAMNSVAALILIILMHLSMRTEEDQNLLPWMFVYALTYTENGMVIHAHHPKLAKTKDASWEWRFASRVVTTCFEAIWHDNLKEDIRMRGFAALCKVRSHTEFLVEQLLAWSSNLPESAKPIIETLIARSNLQMERWDLLLDQWEKRDAKSA